jgi:uncharacterized membrane protein YecN with MAPEG domain
MASGPPSSGVELSSWRMGARVQIPTITAGYLGILALIYAALSIRVVMLRGKYQVSLGDGGNPALTSAIRSPAHFAEYVPLIALMIALLEMSGMTSPRVHLLLGTLLLSRILHPLGMSARPRTWRFRLFRTGGVSLTFLLLIGCAIALLVRFVARG